MKSVYDKIKQIKDDDSNIVDTQIDNEQNFNTKTIVKEGQN